MNTTLTNQIKKYCSQCHVVKPTSDFAPKNKDHTRFKDRCKPCYNEYHRKWRYTQKILKGLGS